MLILLAAVYFVLMAIETMFVNTSSCTSEIVEVHLDVLVVLAVMFDMVAPSFTIEGLPVVPVLVGEATLATIGSCGD